jgi:hypothetical protein
MRFGSRLADLALLLLAAAVLVGSVAVLRGYSLAGAPAVTPPQELPPLRVLAVVDELAGPAEASAQGSSAIELAATSLGWELTLLPARGVGYTAAPAGQSNLAGLIEQSFPEGSYDVVVLQAGAPDAEAARGEIGAGALGTIRRIRDRVELGTRIVLVGPAAAPARVPDLAAVREVLEAVATRERVFFLDPVAEGWLSSESQDEALRQRELGRRLAEEMRELKLAS